MKKMEEIEIEMEQKIKYNKVQTTITTDKPVIRKEECNDTKLTSHDKTLIINVKGPINNDIRTMLNYYNVTIEPEPNYRERKGMYIEGIHLEADDKIENMYRYVSNIGKAAESYKKIKQYLANLGITVTLGRCIYVGDAISSKDCKVDFI